MKNFNTHLGNLYKDQNGKFVAGGNSDAQPELQLKKVNFDKIGRIIVDGKLQKYYSVAYLSSNRIVLGIKARDFAANTPMFLGGNEDLEYLASNENMNIRATTEQSEIEQETQGKFKIKEIRKSTEDYSKPIRSIEVAFDSNATDEEKNSAGSKYFPLEPRGPRTHKSCAEMKGLVVLDFDDFKRVEGLNSRSTPMNIKKCLIHYCQELKAIEGDMDLHQFIHSESSNIFVADFQVHLDRTSNPADLDNFIDWRIDDHSVYFKELTPIYSHYNGTIKKLHEEFKENEHAEHIKSSKREIFQTAKLGLAVAPSGRPKNILIVGAGNFCEFLTGNLHSSVTT